MQSRIINDGLQRTFARSFPTGDEVVSNLTSFARQYDVAAAAFTGLGALSDLVLGYFDWQTKQYHHIKVDEQVEAVSFLGNFALDEHGRPSVHPHIVVSKRDGTAHGGHLIEGHARPIIEVIVTEQPTYLQRRHDPESGLALIRL